MAKQRVVNTRFWDDDYIMQLGPAEKLLFLYCLTNPLTDLCGAYEIGLKRIAFDTGLKVGKVEAILKTFEAAGKIAYRRGWLMIRNFGKHQQGNSPNVRKGAERALNSCPDWVKQTLTKGFETPSIENALLPIGITSRENLTEQPEPVGTTEAAAPALDEVMDGLRTRLNLNTLRDEQGWSDSAIWAFGNGFTPIAFLECFDLLARQKWRKGRITPKNVADNLPELPKLRKEIAEQNGGPSQVGKDTGVTATVEIEPCHVCGAEICFRDHRYDQAA